MRCFSRCKNAAGIARRRPNSKRSTRQNRSFHPTSEKEERPIRPLFFKHMSGRQAPIAASFRPCLFRLLVGFFRRADLCFADVYIHLAIGDADPRFIKFMLHLLEHIELQVVIIRPVDPDPRDNLDRVLPVRADPDDRRRGREHHVRFFRRRKDNSLCLFEIILIRNLEGHVEAADRRSGMIGYFGLGGVVVWDEDLFLVEGFERSVE